MKTAQDVMDALKPGETVIIEYDSLTSPAVCFYYIVRWAKERGYRIVIDDVLDTLYLYRAHLKLAGIDVGDIDDVEVIKEAGLLNVGKVVARLELKQYAIRKVEYERVYEPLLDRGQVIDIVLGSEKLFVISDIKAGINLINAILSYTGDERRIAFYFINRDLLEINEPRILSLLEEVATTVIKMTKEKSQYLLSVMKSINPDIEGVKVTLSRKRDH